MINHKNNQQKPRNTRSRYSCSHRRQKENFPFGRHSDSIKSCKDCGIVITKKMISKGKDDNYRNSRRRR